MTGLDNEYKRRHISALLVSARVSIDRLIRCLWTEDQFDEDRWASFWDMFAKLELELDDLCKVSAAKSVTNWENLVCSQCNSHLRVLAKNGKLGRVYLRCPKCKKRFEVYVIAEEADRHSYRTSD